MRGGLPLPPAKAKAFEKLRSLAQPADSTGGLTPDKPTASTEPPKPPATVPTTPQDKPKPPTAPPTPPADKTAPEPAKPAETTPPKDKQASPWKLVDTYKKRAAALEHELAEAKKQVLDPQAAEGLTQRAERAEAALKEALEEIRYQNYAKHPEFKEKYEVPYQKAWQRAVADVTQLSVEGETGARQATAEDLWEVVNLPLGAATQRAKQLFGDEMGTYVMAQHYGKVRELAEAQTEALEKARKEGGEREKNAQEGMQKLRVEVSKTFETIRDQDITRRDFLQPKEGDDEWNGRLDKAVQFVDETMKASVFNPKLTPEERNTLIAQHVAVRNRAIGYSMLKLQVKRLTADLADRDKKLAAYSGAQPGAGEGKPGGGEAPVGATPSTMEAMKARIRAMAKPSVI